MTPRTLLRVALACFVAGSLAFAAGCDGNQPEPPSPAPDKNLSIGLTYPHYPDHFIQEHDRRMHGRPAIPYVLSMLALKEGDVVADIGCGTGSFTFPLAQAVGPRGRVYAIDIQSRMIDVVKEHMADRAMNPYDNVIAFVNQPDDAMLEPASLDVAWLSGVHFHCVPELLDANKRMIASIFRALKPGGLVAIRDEPVAGVPDPAPNVIRHYMAAGFIHEAGPIADAFVPTTFHLFFRKPRTDDGPLGS